MSQKIVFLAVCSALYAVGVQAEEKTLSAVEVVSKKRVAGVAAVHKNRQQIQEELITDSQDLVRYTTDVGISDSGRHIKGFAMRGVEGNRVGITIDGVALPDSEENSLYARYGNFNSSRLSIDPELVRGIDIERGADSFKSGSGSLGGSVAYRTLNSHDIVLRGKKWGMLLKSGYASKRREWVSTIGTGYRGSSLDALLLYSQRRGHELDSTGSGEDIKGDKRGIPDPAKHRFHSYLAKIAYRFNDTHRIGYVFNGQNGNNKVDEKSYALFSTAWRNADDQHRRLNHNIFYEYTPDSPYLALIKVDYDRQNTHIAAVNYKGSEDWLTKKPVLDEVANRQMKTRFDRLSIRADSQPLASAFGEHQLTVRSDISERKFENINVDAYYLNAGVSSIKGSIQHPVKTRSFSASILDNIRFSQISTRIGLRYDHHRVAPQALNADCFNCDKEVPAANTFNGFSGIFGIDKSLNKNWTVSYDLSSGFRIPSASEMYFTYNHPAGNWLANQDLKAEKSINHSLSLLGEGKAGKLKMTVYHNRYRNFLYEQQTVGRKLNPYYDQCAWYGCAKYNESLYMQMVNIDKAIINGIDIQGTLKLNAISRLPEGWSLTGGLGYSHGKLSSGTSLLSIQPIKILGGISYEQPNGKWGVHARATYLGRKKAEDATVVNYRMNWRTRSFERISKPYPYLNKSATLFDVYGYYKPSKNIVLRAGLYNIFDRKYQTWDALRGINEYSTTNSVDREGKGLERFYAPGRNFAFSLEIKF